MASTTEHDSRGPAHDQTVKGIVAGSPFMAAAGAVIVCAIVVVILLALTGTIGDGPLTTSKPQMPEIAYIPNSTTRLEQLIGDVDAQTKQPTLNSTGTRYGIQGTDLGYSFEYRGQTVFLFGDTIGAKGGDALAWSGSADPNGPLTLNFMTGSDGQYLPLQPTGVHMGPYEVPVGGIEVNGAMYVAVKSAVARDWPTAVTVITRYDDNTNTFTTVRPLSKLPDGHFITLSLRHAPQGLLGLPTNEPYVLIFGSGEYRKSDAYLAAVPAAGFESGVGTVYYSGRDGTGPKWSALESDAVPVIDHDTIGDISVTFVPQIGQWVALYDSHSPDGILMRYAAEPWGPWSEPQVVFAGHDGKGIFIHDPARKDNDGLAGPIIAEGKRPEEVAGGYYAPYIIDRLSRLEGDVLTLQYVLSTWNPYTVVRMQSSLRVPLPPPAPAP
jgi:hypothetical protein